MSDTADLVPRFLAALAPELRAPFAAQHDLEFQLLRVLSEARAAWPSFEVPLEVFLAAIATRLADGKAAPQCLRRLRTTDLYLAQGCCRRAARAVAEFEATVLLPICQKLVRRGIPADVVEDTSQLVHQKLFVGTGGRPPRIADYTGETELENWVRVIAYRIALNLLRKRRREASLEESLAEIGDQLDDPEILHLKRVLKQEFQGALQQAFATLTARERNLLRYQYQSGLNFDRIGALHGVNRSTICRWLAKAREKLQKKTRNALIHKLSIDRSSFSTVMRLIQSQIDVSVRALLKSQE
jgi:RNA polymerase sigma-70 factor, ECF subfamily